MKIRIINEGQYEVSEALVASLNDIDERLIAAVDAQDEATFRTLLREIHETVVGQGTRVPDDYLGPSDLVLPDRETELSEIHDFLGDEGLIPD